MIVLEKDIFLRYTMACKKIRMYFRGIPPAMVENNYKHALLMLRNHLDDNGIKMPYPLYPIDKENKDTYAYVECLRNKQGKIISHCRHPQRNPNYVYRDIWKFNPKRIKVEIK